MYLISSQVHRCVRRLTEPKNISFKQQIFSFQYSSSLSMHVNQPVSIYQQRSHITQRKFQNHTQGYTNSHFLVLKSSDRRIVSYRTVSSLARCSNLMQHDSLSCGNTSGGILTHDTWIVTYRHRIMCANTTYKCPIGLMSGEQMWQPSQNVSSFHNFLQISFGQIWPNDMMDQSADIIHRCWSSGSS